MNEPPDHPVTMNEVLAAENVRLRSEVHDLIAQRTATADILRVIASTPGDPTHALDTIAETAVRMFDADSVAIRRIDENKLSVIAAAGPYANAVRSAVPQIPLDLEFPAARCVFENRQIQEHQNDNPLRRAVGQRSGTTALTPLSREGEAIGAMMVNRNDVRPFLPNELELMRAFADQAVIAIENARLITELGESLDRQTATSEVLSVISSSPGELTPVFETMLDNATRICKAQTGVLYRYDGEKVEIMAARGHGPDFTVEVNRVIVPPNSPLGRMIGTKTLVHVPDLSVTQEYLDRVPPVVAAVEIHGTRTVVFVPMLQEDDLVGCFVLQRKEVCPFTDKQIELVESFAAQAVIAIENARLLTELHSRTDELTETLERQIATSEVLAVISSSPGTLEPVYRSMLSNAVRICQAAHGGLVLRDGDDFKMVAAHGISEAAAAFGAGGWRPAPGTGLRIAETTLRTCQILDVAVEPAYRSILAMAPEFAQFHTFLHVPLVKDGNFIGAIVLLHTEVRSFPEKQIDLVENFAAQAVIAIENARLLTELRESLERQTATADVLGVISASLGALQPVFETMLDNAVRICEATQGGLWRVENGRFYREAERNQPEIAAALQGFVPPSGSAPGLMLGTRTTFHIDDLVRLTDPMSQTVVSVGGIRTALWVPMVRDQSVVGAFSLARAEVRPFTDKEIELVENFAAQAVIAIENARLLTELRQRTDELTESLEQQTATSEVLSVISTSPGELQPVFETMLENAVRLCEAAEGAMFQVSGDALQRIASRGMAPELSAIREVPASPGTPPGEMLSTHKTVHVPDYVRLMTELLADDPIVRTVVEQAGVRSALWVPMVKDNEVVGAFALNRRETRPFTDKQIALVENFAAQAVIAIENARLLSELRESLERQTATADILRVIASTPGDPKRALDTMAETALRLFGAGSASFLRVEGGMLRSVSFAGPFDTAIHTAMPNVPLDPAYRVARCVLEGRQIEGDTVTSHTNEWMRQSGQELPIRSVAFTPLLRQGEAIGAMVVNRSELRPFTPSELELMRGFADQAVIAIENARLLTELRQRTTDLQEALDYQTATSDVLKVISRSTVDLDAVLQTVVTTAVRLCRAEYAVIFRNEGDDYRWVAGHGLSPEYVRMERESPIRPGRGTLVGRVALEGRTVRLEDAWTDPLYEAKDMARTGNARSMLGVPLLREGTVIGVIGLARGTTEPYSEREVQLVTTFADQAVIAIENARLFGELRESLDRQTATSEVLGVISSSPGELQPVFDTILDNAVRLCDAAFGSMHLIEGNRLRPVAAIGVPSADAEKLPELMRDASAATPAVQAANRKRTVHIPDITVTDAYRDRDPMTVAIAELYGSRAVLAVPMLRDNQLVGVFAINRRVARPFTDKQIELVENFAAQAVIAIENARLLTELRERTDELAQRQAELRVTFDNMGDGVAMFDAELRLAAWNRNLQEILDLPDAFFATPRTYRDYIAYLIEHGEFGDVDLEAEVRRYVESADQQRRVERMRPDGRVLEVRVNPVPGGGFVAIYSDITERKRAEEQVSGARDAAEKALGELKAAQANLVQAEKMASLGQLTAGIAHEIKNPLNFVNNFAGLSVELLDELKQATAPAMASLDQEKRVEVDEVVAMLTGNLEKIAEHGRRADGIVKSMLAHSRGGSGEWQSVNINALVEESLNLAYHGARAQDQNFNITLERDFDQSIAPLQVVPQDITRVFLNLFGNGFYAANKRRTRSADPAFKPVLKVTVRDLDADVAISIRDNGIGIPFEIMEKLFEPFFTTKPTGEGTGLGLSISYEIVTQQHGGTIEVESQVGEFTEFTIRLPRRFGATAASIPRSTGGRS